VLAFEDPGCGVAVSLLPGSGVAESGGRNTGRPGLGRGVLRAAFRAAEAVPVPFAGASPGAVLAGGTAAFSAAGVAAAVLFLGGLADFPGGAALDSAAFAGGVAAPEVAG
jgi:hypothetical protein